jgi:uncharacterized membrane protein
MIQEIMNMISTATNLLHPMMTHFPLALLSASFVLDIAAHWWPKLRTSGWVLLILGTIGAIFAVITGNVDGELYEDSVAGGVVETHQTLAITTTVIFSALLVWRFFARRKGNDSAEKWYYFIPATIGMGLLLLTGLYGGHMVYAFGLGVMGP